MCELTFEGNSEGFRTLGNAITIDGFRGCGFDRTYEWVTNRRVPHACFP